METYNTFDRKIKMKIDFDWLNKKYPRFQDNYWILDCAYIDAKDTHSMLPGYVFDKLSFFARDNELGEAPCKKYRSADKAIIDLRRVINKLPEEFEEL